MIFGWFRKKPAPPAPPAPFDARNWNEDWKVGDTAECIVASDGWHESVKPWNRPALGEKFTVIGFSDEISKSGGKRAYFLALEGWPVALETAGFRKVRPVATEQSEVISRILNAKPGADNPRVEA